MRVTKRWSMTIAALVAVALALVPLTAASTKVLATRADADWTEHYFPAGDGLTTLHADVLRPKGLAADVKTPVILTVSPYTNHNGSTTDLDPSGTGPNPRFYDFLDLSGALTKGYTYVYVDLPGFGGSSGCNDWGGAREQNAVRAAVEWAASQSWSTGKVGLIGKSYDGWTGLMGIAQQPKGLAAVASMEPVYDGYRYIYMNGVRRSSTVGTLALFQAIDAKPGRPGDTPQYHANGAPQAWCYGVNVAGGAADTDANGPYWNERNLIPTTLGKTTPLFLTQGFLETNTHTDGAFQYFNGLAGDQNRAWFGQFDHVRGWETNADGSRFQTGRSIFVEELMRFFDEHLKGIEPAVEDPTVAVQDNLGRYRAEASWPPADMRLFTTELKAGTISESGSGSGLRPTAGQGIWSVSQELPNDAWFAGEPVITAGIDALVPNANLAANVYDISPEGEATMISRGVSLLRGTGQRSVSFTLYGQDWLIPAGHRIGVLISSANTDVFTHVATRQTVTVRHAKIALPFLTFDRDVFLDGGSTPRLEAYLPQATSTPLDESQLAAAEVGFTLPPKLAGQSGGQQAAA